MKLKKLTLILAALMFAVNILTAQEKKLPKVAVSTFDITAGAVNGEEAEAITELFISELVSTGKVDVVDRANFDKIIKEMKFQASDWSNKEKTAALGNAVNATMVVRGQIIKLGSKMYLSSTIIDVKTASVLSSAREQFNSLDDIFGLLTNFAKKAVEGLYLKVGDIGPGGGIVFYIEGTQAYEVSEALGNGTWEEAKKIASSFNGGGFYDWYLPTIEQLRLVCSNLVETQKITIKGVHWSASLGSRFSSDIIYTMSFGSKESHYEYRYSSYGKGQNSSYSVRAVRVFSIEELPSNKNEFVEKKDNDIDKSTSNSNSSNKKEYKIGDSGPGGGIIFHKIGTRCLEISPSLGNYGWNDAKIVAQNYRGGNFRNWYLPSKEELKLVYDNLVKTGLLQDTAWHWSSSPYGEERAWFQTFSGGRQSANYRGGAGAVRAVRAFNIE